MLAMNLGVKVMVIIVWQQTVQEEGFFIPLEYGEITDFVWLPLNTLMISLSNGYVLVVDADLLMDKARSEFVCLASIRLAPQLMTSAFLVVPSVYDLQIRVGCEPWMYAHGNTHRAWACQFINCNFGHNSLRVIDWRCPIVKRLF